MRWSGDLVELDTLTVSLFSGKEVKQFTARDVERTYVERAQGIHGYEFYKS